MTVEEAWREHVDRELKHLREHLELAIKRESDLWRADAHATEKARSLQALKDKEHFEALNHENARVLAASNLSVPREKYEADREGDQAAAKLLRDQVHSDIDTRTGAAASKADIKSYIAIAIAVVGMLLSFFRGTP